MKKFVVVTDFDGTLMEQDVSDAIMEALGIDRTPELKAVVERIWAGTAGSKEWLTTGYRMVEGRQAEVDEVLKGIVPRAGAHDLVDFCQARGIQLVVLSDGMEYYIEHLMAKHELVADEVIVNPIRFEADGSFTLELQNRNAACSWCGCCKADVVRQWRAEGAHIIYIGDGFSDMFGSMFADTVFARSSLARYLQEQGQPYYPFETFHDVLKVLGPIVDESNQALKERVNRVHPFCKFATD